MGSEWRAHIVLIPFFSASHSIPFFDFALRLAQKSVKVTILTAEYHENKLWSGDPLYWNWAPRLRGAGAGAGAGAIEVVGVRDGMYDGTWEGFGKVVRDSACQAKLINAFGVHLAGLMAREYPPCCVVSDYLVGWTCELAKRFGIPRILLHIQPASNLSLMLRVSHCSLMSLLLLQMLDEFLLVSLKR